MTKEETLYLEIGTRLIGSVQSQMFGKPCFKINGKAYICFFQNQMVFKLSARQHEEALSKNGASLFDPSGKGRPMKEWVQVPGEHSAVWKKFAKASLDYVGEGKS